MPDIVTYATVGKAYYKLDKKENNLQLDETEAVASE
jgi:hypothetical protein